MWCRGVGWQNKPARPAPMFIQFVGGGKQFHLNYQIRQARRNKSGTLLVAQMFATESMSPKCPIPRTRSTREAPESPLVPTLRKRSARWTSRDLLGDPRRKASAHTRCNNALNEQRKVDGQRGDSRLCIHAMPTTVCAKRIAPPRHAKNIVARGTADKKAARRRDLATDRPTKHDHTPHRACLFCGSSWSHAGCPCCNE